MNESGKFEIYQKKLQGICDENDLVGRFYYDKYPIKMIVQPCSNLDSQMSMLEGVEDDGSGYISPDASITFYFEDGEISERIKGTFDMSDTLKTKLKGLYKKMHYLYLQFFHREMVKHGGFVPKIAQAKPEGAVEAVEEYEQEELPCSDIEPKDSVGIPALSADDPDVKTAISIARIGVTIDVGTFQTEMGVGYPKAAQLMVTLEKLGVVGPYNNGEPRDVLPWDEPDDNAEE